MEELNKEIMNEATEVVMENIIDSEVTNKNGVIGLAVGLGALAVAGIGAALYKGRGKLEEMNIRRLEKKGYVIAKPEPVEEKKGDSNK